MARFVFDLGNNRTRKGHRADCAQVEVSIAVDAPDYPAALQQLAMGKGTIRHWTPGSVSALAKAPCYQLPGPGHDAGHTHVKARS